MLRDIYDFLWTNEIEFERIDHPPVFTCAEAARVMPDLSGLATKNLFLRDKKDTALLLVVVSCQKKVDLRGLAAQIGLNHLGLASPERLRRHLGVEPGAVTLLALVNDEKHAVRVVFDREVWDAPAVQAHPLVNTASLIISHAGLERFMSATGHPFSVLSIPAAGQP